MIDIVSLKMFIRLCLVCFFCFLMLKIRCAGTRSCSLVVVNLGHRVNLGQYWGMFPNSMQYHEIYSVMLLNIPK